MLLLPARAITGKMVQRACWKIWKHCRLNDTSLDSETHCELIEEVVAGAIASVQRRLEDAMVSEAKMKAELAAARQLNAALKGNIKQLTEVRDKALLAMEDTKNVAHEANLHIERLAAAINMLIDETVDRVPDEKECVQETNAVPPAHGSIRE